MLRHQLQDNVINGRHSSLLLKLFGVGSLLSIAVLAILNRPLTYAFVYIGVVLLGSLVVFFHIRYSQQIFTRRALPYYGLLALFVIACMASSLLIHGVNTTHNIMPLNQTYEGFPFSWLSHYVLTPQYIPRSILPTYMDQHAYQVQSEWHQRSIVIDSLFYIHVGIIIFAGYQWVRNKLRLSA
ncbi:hypothetical protein [Ktedonospora formicarum]|uniref:Uncharacterized protein n=1 Tax=Ktedonospora formicarum TaxID=2778364 RepID=A0A8J3HY04_9CHLR|nr:hypothetical protein [Ktedonospora formicarum]GHO42603.1 hypothetical protein KSX_07660 [Ktedonospora formicarum]